MQLEKMTGLTKFPKGDTVQDGIEPGLPAKGR